MTVERDLQLDNMCWTDHLSRKQVPVEWLAEQRHPPSFSFLSFTGHDLSIRDEAENYSLHLYIRLRTNCIRVIIFLRKVCNIRIRND